jgi:glycosyltransferase involved in cell wall biosynthesis
LLSLELDRPVHSDPVVSIVLPAHNAADTIGRAVRDVRAQTLERWELILVNDGSTDGTGRAAAAAAAGDPRVRLLHAERGGIVAALNVGVAAARGRFIARMDADDETMPRRLAAQVALLETRPDIGVASSLVEFGGDRAAARGYALHVEWMNSLLEPEAIAVHRFIESPLAHPSVMFRRELIERHGGYLDTGEPEDYELWLRWMEAGVRFAKVPDVLLRWNDPPERLSRTSVRYSTAAFYACKCRYLARWLLRHGDERPVWLWGAGRITRKRFVPLEAAGVKFAAFVDIDPNKAGRVIGGRRVHPPAHLPPPDETFVIAAVGVRGARDLIRVTLEDRGFVLGKDFMMAA